MVTSITFENYKSHIGKRVEVEICCYSGGMMYPDNNILLGMNEGNFYFKSEDEDGDNQYWHWTAIDDKECSIQVWDYDEYMEFYNRSK